MVQNVIITCNIKLPSILLMKNIKNSILIVIVSIFFSYCHSNKVESAKIQLKADTVHLKSLILNELTEEPVRIDNIGNGDLEIKNIQSSCDCTVPILEDSIILPGNHTFFTLRITPNDTGAFNRSVVIESNDKEIYKILEVNGFVKKE